MAPSFLSRLSSGNPLSRKVSSRSASTAPSTAPENESSYLPLDLPSPSLLNHGELAPSTPPPSGKSNRLNGGRDLSASPWVSVGVAGAAQTPQSSKDPQYSETAPGEAEREGKKRLARATLGVAEVTILVQECGRVIRERGESYSLQVTCGIRLRVLQLPDRPRHSRLVPTFSSGRIASRDQATCVAFS